MNSFIASLLQNKVLELTSINGKDTYTLTANKSVILLNDVINKIKIKYISTGEIGGVFGVRVVNETQLVAEDVYFFDNTLSDPSKYSPNYSQYHRAVNEIVIGKKIPFFFHTHPTKLGIKSYDGKRAYFYLTSSFADRDASFFPYSIDGTEIVTPSVILVADERFEGGIGVSMYGGNIFPLSFSRLRGDEITILKIIGVLAALLLLTKKRKGVIFLAIAAFGVLVYYLIYKPSYTHLPNGDIVIHS